MPVKVLIAFSTLFLLLNTGASFYLVYISLAATSPYGNALRSQLTSYVSLLRQPGGVFKKFYNITNLTDCIGSTYSTSLHPIVVLKVAVRPPTTTGKGKSPTLATVSVQGLKKLWFMGPLAVFWGQSMLFLGNP